MDNRINILKGLHPGVFLQRELKKRKLKSGQFAESIGEHPQTMSAIIRGRRSMNTPLSLRIEKALELEEGFLMSLQIFYDIALEKQKTAINNRPDISKFSPTLFWDTSIDNINFAEHSKFVINRVFERGTESEIDEIIRFYGREKILSELDITQHSPFAINIRKNLKQYLNYEA
jgi:addiction module HigA family antidote